MIDYADSLNRNHVEKYSSNGLDYVFAHFCGIIVTSTLYLVLYIIRLRFQPQVYPHIVLPGLVSGVMWAIAQTMWFIANDSLGIVVAFPLVVSLPPLVSCCWGVLLFKEIKGSKNLSILGLAFATVAVGVTLITVSKV
eukprot:NODE_4975_length_612_cov_59.285968_g4290_i0.p1 GENE.NODE_4975_length_612_cov_59.285968_g4290_i0~~NODE_4975_length_612_cov_59.285968_g4290_i0.p1  ORF type:complete len:138 (-),score=19.64 NODE_4975_length_612_cov_59.285968_g4290_i0:12-425(-)